VFRAAVSVKTKRRANTLQRALIEVLGWQYSDDYELFAASRYSSGRRCSGLLAAAAGLRGSFRSFADQFHGHQDGNEFLEANAVEINGGALGVGFSHDAKTVLLVLDALTFGKNLHNCLLV
jgi:hypothetical protein